jgi:Zn-dependent peptidase ImmA (M78 family)/DNA-binding XRE family transcriptional regulator
MVNGDRVRQARELNRLSQSALACAINIKQPAIAQIESGKTQPTDTVLQGIAFQTGFPLQFFRLPTAIDFPLGTLLFRAKASIAAIDRDEARQLARTVYEEFVYLQSFTSKIPLRLPVVDDSPKKAATLARSSFGLSPDTPIANLVRTAERAGIVILALPKSLEKRDAFSAWVDSDDHTPVVVLSKNDAGDRLRFSLAHEIGHLVLHRSIKTEAKQIEREADEFAAELLLPEEAMKREMLQPITLTSLSKLKPTWKVSIQALIRRARDLDYITDRRYRYLMQQLAAKGWRLHEPSPIEPEKPRAFRKMAELVYGNPNSYRQLASALSHPASFVRATLEAHAGRMALPKPTGPATVQNIADFMRRTKAERS